MPVIKICKNCGAEFKIKPSHINRRANCSTKCKAEQRMGKTYEESYGVKKAKELKDLLAKKHSKKIEWKENEDGCWICTSHFARDYPKIKIKQKVITIHRFFYMKYVGNIPDDLCVLHKCDNTKCINPEHLFLGTIGDNNRDCVAKGRTAKGEKNGSAKLAESQVRVIKISDKSNRVLGKEYDVSHRIISLIRQNRLWKHVQV